MTLTCTSPDASLPYNGIARHAQTPLPTGNIAQFPPVIVVGCALRDEADICQSRYRRKSHFLASVEVVLDSERQDDTCVQDTAAHRAHGVADNSVDAENHFGASSQLFFTLQYDPGSSAFTIEQSTLAGMNVSSNVSAASHIHHRKRHQAKTQEEVMTKRQVRARQTAVCRSKAIKQQQEWFGTTNIATWSNDRTKLLILGEAAKERIEETCKNLATSTITSDRMVYRFERLVEWLEKRGRDPHSPKGKPDYTKEARRDLKDRLGLLIARGCPSAYREYGPGSSGFEHYDLRKGLEGLEKSFQTRLGFVL